jgi:hypothetical protein
MEREKSHTGSLDQGNEEPVNRGPRHAPLVGFLSRYPALPLRGSAQNIHGSVDSDGTDSAAPIQKFWRAEVCTEQHSETDILKNQGLGLGGRKRSVSDSKNSRAGIGPWPESAVGKWMFVWLSY